MARIGRTGAIGGVPDPCWECDSGASMETDSYSEVSLGLACAQVILFLGTDTEVHTHALPRTYVSYSC